MNCFFFCPYNFSLFSRLRVSRVRKIELRKRKHENKPGGNWRDSSFPPPPPFPRSRAHTFACITLNASSSLSASLQTAIIILTLNMFKSLCERFGFSVGTGLISLILHLFFFYLESFPNKTLGFQMQKCKRVCFILYRSAASVGS